MSYLNPLRLHFAGQFQANVSTVNNDGNHFNNENFKPSFQYMQTGSSPNGWFNPQGDAAWRLLGCKVTDAWMGIGVEASATDPIRSAIVADSDTQTCGKLVDLDPLQQLVSTPWGFQVRIADQDGATLLRGDYKPAAFMDIWLRVNQPGDSGAAAAYLSVLENLQWGDTSKSPFLEALRQKASSGKLSIKFNVDNINMNFTSPEFMCGRIVGTIGPAYEGEPDHLVLGRQFMATTPDNMGFSTPTGLINYFVGSVDNANQGIFLDLGNALPTTPKGSLADLGDLVLSAPSGESGPANFPLGTIKSQGATGYASDPSWYGRTAGVVWLPLSPEKYILVNGQPLTLSSASNPTVTISETLSGKFVRADNFVFRMSPGDQANIPIYATQFGNPLSDEPIAFYYDASNLQPVLNPDNSVAVQDSTPLSALQFNAYGITDAKGVTSLNVTAGDPGNPRGFIDGQVYGVRPSFIYDSAESVANPWNFVSFLLWNAFEASDSPTWFPDLQPVFQQYANLYPVMSRFLDLGDYDSVVANAGPLTFVFQADTSNPNSMPVTRDLSPAKRKAILAFLAHPELGVPPEKLQEKSLTQSSPNGASSLPPPGGKTAAATRRNRVRHLLPRA